MADKQKNPPTFEHVDNHPHLDMLYKHFGENWERVGEAIKMTGSGIGGAVRSGKVRAIMELAAFGVATKLGLIGEAEKKTKADVYSVMVPADKRENFEALLKMADLEYLTVADFFS